ncbi:MAG: glycosyltransferase family 2 protein [Bdellovibrionales bacterium]|nr:glycosyltransferase family 2 protein [Bdellovibrionales bacterium]
MSKNLLVIPVYNEAETIRGVMCELRRHYFGEVLIVDDGSSDASIESLGRCDMKRVNVLRHAENKGYGASLIDGFEYAIKHGFDKVVTMDCDWQHEPVQVPEFLEGLDHADVVSGSRYLKMFLDDADAPPDRKEINRKITKRINEITGFNLTDAFCGFKGYRVGALKNLHLNEYGYAFPLQFWVQAAHHHLSICEIPVKRIYKNMNRTFGNGLDNPEVRESYYLEVLKREQEICQSTAW